MSVNLAERLNSIRHRQFVGRSEELALFQSALEADEPPFVILHISGPGGVGKTSLLNEFVVCCERSDTPALRLDARHIEPTPDSFLTALRQALRLSPEQNPLDALHADNRRHVLLIDTYEMLEPLDAWMRDDFLLQLPQNILVTLAGRQPLDPAWRSDSGWQPLLRSILLGNLSPEDCERYLRARAVPAENRQAALDFTHGFPLALSLLADLCAQRGGDNSFESGAVQDVLQTLLTRFVQEVPSPDHRAALDMCALVRVTTESLLAETLDRADTHDLFAWLCKLSIIEMGPTGIFPHDMAREALLADLRWRDLQRYTELHRRASHYYATRLRQTSGAQQQSILYDHVFLHRDNSVVRACFEWKEAAGIFPRPAQPADVPALIAMIAEHEGVESARIAERWMEAQPQGLQVFRETLGVGANNAGPAGFSLMVSLTDTDPELRGADPATQAAWNSLERNAPLRPGETAVYFRFWMTRDTYQSVSGLQSLIFVNMVRYCLVTPGVAYVFVPYADPDFWALASAYADLHRLPEADFEVGARRYGVYGHDWRVMPPMAWLSLLAEREVAGDGAEASAPSTLSRTVFSEEAFAEAARDALRGYACPQSLRSNPLMQSRIVIERAADVSEESRLEALRALLNEAVEARRSAPRQAKARHALFHTYIEPASSQEVAAEQLDLPFSTYRRHLKTGIDLVTATLWQREIGR